MMARWCVFYADETIVYSDHLEPSDIPGLGVIVIVQEHEDPQERPYLQHMTDYYVWKGDRWQGCDLFYLWQYMFVEKFEFEKVALAGQTVRNTEFEEIRKQARTLRDKWYDNRNV
jgi:hypothetical protein